MMQLREEAQLHISKNFSKVLRKLYGGNYLKKISKNGELMWVRSNPRPRDVLTLLRNVMIYRLSRRGGLFMRSFMSEDENYIFLVVKASEQHL